MRSGTLPYFNALADTRRCLPLYFIVRRTYDAVNQKMAVGRRLESAKHHPTAILFFCADVQKQATNGSRKATPEGVFDRARKRPGPGLEEAPTSVSECPKGYSETLLAQFHHAFAWQNGIVPYKKFADVGAGASGLQNETSPH